MSERANEFEEFFTAPQYDASAEYETSSLAVKRKPVSLWLRIVGVIGELMICAGSVLGLFVLWQVWWTNAQMSGEQDRLVAATQKEFGEVSTDVIGEPAEGDPPQISSDLAQDSVIGLMHIPVLGGKSSTQIREGESLSVLDQGVFGHYSDTAMPGEVGNFSLAIHRDSYGSRLLNIDKLRVGDAIVVETQDTWYVYKFKDSEIVDPTDVYVVSPDPYAAKTFPNPNAVQVSPSGRYLTITTCHPPMVSNKRWVVHAEFAYWMPRSSGTPSELVDTQASNITVESTGTTIRDSINDAINEMKKSRDTQNTEEE